MTAKQQKTVSLAPVLDLKAAAPLAEELLTLRGTELEIDVSAVQRIGAQCIQVLLAARRSWRDDGCRLQVTGSSEAFSRSVQLVDATKFLFEPVEIPS